jgi:predicted methyltransferase
MRLQQQLFVAAAMSLVCGGFESSAYAADATPAAVVAAVRDNIRMPGDLVRDRMRDPTPAIAFSRIKAGDKVADLLPGDGYYTRILSKLVGPKGTVYAMAGMTWRGDLESMLVKNKAAVKQGGEPTPNPIEPLLAVQNITSYSNVVAMLYQLGAYDGQFTAPEQLDAVFTADHYQDLHNPALAVSDKVGAVTKQIFASLKPGGTYTVIADAAARGAGFTKSQSLGRVEADAVKAEVIAAGFTLDGESNAFANPADDHSKATSDASVKNKADQFILRFKKPAKASAATQRPGPNAMTGYYGNTAISTPNTPAPRWMYYNKDWSYLEMGDPDAPQSDHAGDVQIGTYYWDAAGHNCMIHQYPAEERGFVVCHTAIVPGEKVGQTWTIPGSTRSATLQPGNQYPKAYNIKN